MSYQQFKLHTQTCCYYDFQSNKSAIIQGYISQKDLWITYYQEFSDVGIHELAELMKARAGAIRKYTINENEPFSLLLGVENTKTPNFTGENEYLLLTYKAAYDSLCKGERINSYNDVEIPENELSTNAICLLLLTFKEYLFGRSGNIKLGVPPGGKVHNPFKNDDYDKEVTYKKVKVIESSQPPFQSPFKNE